jgi:AtzE family amidohydrolase
VSQPALSSQVQSATTIADQVRSGVLRAEDHIQQVLDRIQLSDGPINAFSQVTRSRALAKARSVDQEVMAGRDPGPLAGTAFAAKNLFDIAGLPTLAGSKINRERPPASQDATLIRRLEKAGAVLVGANNMDEFAFGFTTENTHYGATHNPHDLSRTAGGSSGGSAAAVAAGMVPVSLASDTNGSIRVPASLCGVFGLKPTYGRLSRAGSFPFVASLDHVGPLARTVGDLATVYDVLQGSDVADPACRPGPVEPVLPVLNKGIADLRLALAGGYFEDHAESSVVDVVRRIARALNVSASVEIDHAAEARAAAFIITAVEGAQLHLPNLRRRAQDFEPLTRDRLLANALLPGAWYVQAQRYRRRFYREVLALFERFDAILAPATPRPATLIGQELMTLRGASTLTRPGMGLLTQPISFIGLPVAAVPIGLVDGLPVGMQIIAAPWREDICLRVARTLEDAGLARCPSIARAGS